MRRGDRDKIQNASLIFANGLFLEHNPSLFYQLKKSDAVFIGDEILKRCPELILKVNGEVDPHIWMDLSIMEKVASIICEKVCEIDPDHTDSYRNNTAHLIEEMQACDKRITDLINTIPSKKKYLVSSHDAFNYYSKKYFQSAKKNCCTGSNSCSDDNRLCSMQGGAPESEISLKRMKAVVEFVKKNQVPVIFYESNLPKDAIVKLVEVCKGFGQNVRISEDPLYGDTLGGMTYLQMIEHNTKVIVENLNQENGDNV